MGSISDEISNNNITKTFLADVIGDESQILSYKVTPGSNLGDNYMSIIYSIEVKLQEKGDLVTTRHLLMKCYPTHPSRQEFTNQTNMFFKEMEVYRVWIPELRKFQTENVGLKPNEVLKLPNAPYVHGKCIDFESVEENEQKGKVYDSLDNFIIMEDMRKVGFRMTNRRDSFDIHHMRIVVEALAKIHALSWGYKNIVEKDVSKKFPCLVTNITSDQLDIFNNLLKNNIDLAVQTLDSALGHGNELSKAAMRFKEIGFSVMKTYWCGGDESTMQNLLRVQPDEKFGKDAPNPEPWRIVCHGDCWSNNMLFKYDEKTGRPEEVVLVDLQMVQETCVVNDLVYVMYTNTDGAFRRDHLDEMLELYHDKFNEVCKLLKTETLPGFTLDSFRFRFHRSKLLGYYMVLLGLPLMLKEADKALNIENMEHGKDLADMLSDVSEGANTNTVYRDRLIDATQQLYDQGVI